MSVAESSQPVFTGVETTAPRSRRRHQFRIIAPHHTVSQHHLILHMVIDETSTAVGGSRVLCTCLKLAITLPVDEEANVRCSVLIFWPYTGTSYN
jgi:hypothetical protein